MICRHKHTPPRYFSLHRGPIPCFACGAKGKHNRNLTPIWLICFDAIVFIDVFVRIQESGR